MRVPSPFPSVTVADARAARRPPGSPSRQCLLEVRPYGLVHAWQQFVRLGAGFGVGSEECLHVALESERQHGQGRPFAEAGEGQIDEEIFAAASGDGFPGEPPGLCGLQKLRRGLRARVVLYRSCWGTSEDP